MNKSKPQTRYPVHGYVCIYGGRIFCYVVCVQQRFTEAACSGVLSGDPDTVKALYRRGASQLRLGYLEKAREDLQLAAKLARPAPSRRAAHTGGGEAEA